LRGISKTTSIDVPTSKSIATARSKIVIHLRMRIRIFLHLGPLVEVNHPRGNDSLVDNLVLGLLRLSLSISRCLARSLSPSLALSRFVFRSLSSISLSGFSFSFPSSGLDSVSGCWSCGDKGRNNCSLECVTGGTYLIVCRYCYGM
jgi:hypothetical protein